MEKSEKGYDYYKLNSWSQSYSSIFSQMVDYTMECFQTSQKDLFLSDDMTEEIFGCYKEIQDDYTSIHTILEEIGQYFEAISKDGIGKMWEGASSVQALKLHYLLREYIDNMEYLHELLIEGITQLDKGKEELYSNSASVLALKRILG